MNEPTHEVNMAQVLQILGSKEIEIQVQRAQIAQLQAQVAKLTPKTKKAKVDNVAPIKAAAGG